MNQPQQVSAAMTHEEAREPESVRITSVGTAAFELAQALTEFRDFGGSALEVVEKLETFVNAKQSKLRSEQR